MKYISVIIITTIIFIISCSAIKGNSYKPIVGHPRLLLYENGEKNIAKTLKKAPEIKNVHDSIIRLCNRMVSWPLLEHKLIGPRLLNVSREALRRIFYLSYGYRMTGNLKFAERAKKEMLNVCSFPDWNPTHFLDVCEMTMAIALGYDWLYSNLSKKEREFITTSILNKAFIPSKKNKYNYFYRKANNWNQVCNAGLLYGAIAFKNELPKEADEIITRCIESNPKALGSYFPDGGYPEGYGYWSYGTTSEILIFDALLTSFGTDFGIIPPTGFLNTAKFMTFMTSPTGKCFNFSDTYNVSQGNIASWWISAYTGEMSILGEEIKYISKRKFKIGELRLLPALIIFASRLNNINIGALKMTENYWLSNGLTPVFIYRGGWDNANDTYLGVKGGSPSTSHAHMDAGSFVYEYDGIRWAIDLGMQSYNSLENKGVNLWDTKQDGQRWDILRMRNDYHNTITIDGERHNVNSNAHIIKSSISPDKKGVIIDLTNTVGKVKKAHREVYLNSQDYLTIIDSIVTYDKPIQLKWVMVTTANPLIRKDSIVLSKNGEKMNMVIESSSEFIPKIWDNAPLHDYDEPNEGTIRVGFISEVPAYSKAIFKVHLNPDNNSIN